PDGGTVRSGTGSADRRGRNDRGGAHVDASLPGTATHPAGTVTDVPVPHVRVQLTAHGAVPAPRRPRVRPREPPYVARDRHGSRCVRRVNAYSLHRAGWPAHGGSNDSNP